MLNIILSLIRHDRHLIFNTSRITEMLGSTNCILRIPPLFGLDVKA